MKFTFTIEIDIDVDFEEPAKCHVCDRRIMNREKETLYLNADGYYAWRHVTCDPGQPINIPGEGLNDYWADMARYLSETFPQATTPRGATT